MEEEGVDRVEGNERVGFGGDVGEFRIGGEMVKEIGVKKVKVVSKNGRKVWSLWDLGLEVRERVGIEVRFKSEKEK
ncbi:GTP cyclohydrolase II [Siminovitchia fortis]|uniref:hypothetical protein n=1 Tax=Siminovitchia fortis TaxID=254758 RepID=UPI0011AA0D0D|nr:hypothetical protein [Siminovitchia fortis]